MNLQVNTHHTRQKCTWPVSQITYSLLPLINHTISGVQRKILIKSAKQKTVHIWEAASVSLQPVWILPVWSCVSAPTWHTPLPAEEATSFGFFSHPAGDCAHPGSWGLACASSVASHPLGQACVNSRCTAQGSLATSVPWGLQASFPCTLATGALSLPQHWWSLLLQRVGPRAQHSVSSASVATQPGKSKEYRQ